VRCSLQELNDLLMAQDINKFCLQQDGLEQMTEATVELRNNQQSLVERLLGAYGGNYPPETRRNYYITGPPAHNGPQLTKDKLFFMLQLATRYLLPR
jgi:hypothetical protein